MKNTNNLWMFYFILFKSFEKYSEISLIRKNNFFFFFTRKYINKKYYQSINFFF